MFRTAWAVVPEPAKESRIIDALSEAICKIYCNSAVGFGVLNTSDALSSLNIRFCSYLATHVEPVTLMSTHREDGGSPSISHK